MAKTLPTYGEIKEKIQKELSLVDEEFIDSDEFLGYYNDAIAEAEAEIHGIYEDYFLSNKFLALENGVEEYDLPDDIYGLKIRGIQYSNGSDLIYPIRRIKEMKKFEEIATTKVYSATDIYYRYFIINRSAAEGSKLVLSPPSHEDSEENVTIWYLRSAARATKDSDPCDIPEFINFIYAFLRVACKMKENNGTCPPELIGALEKQRKLMVDTLTNKIPDEDTEIERDFSNYQDHN